MTSPMRRIEMVFSVSVGLSLGLAACSDPTGLELIDEAKVSCAAEDATPEMQAASPTMLPGRACGACHRAGGQAQNSPWTVSGTVYATATSPCNGGGLANMGVDILYAQDDPNGGYHMNDLQPNGRLRTNAVGNFYTAAKFVAPMRIRVYDPANSSRQVLMKMAVGQDLSTGAAVRVDCNSCHYPGSPRLSGNNGRIYLP